ncbi:HNH endonuclease [Micromonospora inyonensis]|uniref:HNH endonuclease n=1 Tax=Micromonospora inyonensis TaxID=47866 RepID=A0A1C6RDC1_9ACTN|nr:HNH endonuclease signature motif containing protein [Micromonospora inyonensis]SCL15089.1 HNH endonuclease [Micromonospora inyonensis]
MPWGRIDDRLAMSVKVRGLADPGATGLRAKKQRAEALGVWTQLLSWVSGERSDGFLTADILDLFGWDEANERLMRARYGRAPLLHRRDDGERCECMNGRTWVDDWDYLIHDYLDRNPSRSENDVHKAKAKELKNSALKAAVRARDRDVCRYCGNFCPFSDRVSDAGLTYDHVDPEIADGLSNLVVACRGCNRRKSKRTPEAAGMVLRPAPGEQPPASGPTSDLSPDLGPDSGPDPGPHSGPDPGPPPTETPATSGNSAPVCLPTSAVTSVPTQVASSPGTGRGGSGTAPSLGPPRPGPPTAHRIGPPTTPRGPLHGSPYLRTSRPLPEHHAGHPPQPDPEHQDRTEHP